MASKRAMAAKQLQRQEEIADRMATIEYQQQLIMEHLGISVPADEEEIELDGEPISRLNTQSSIVDWTALSVAELEEAAQEYGIYDDIIGSGNNGNVIKVDLVAALIEYHEL